MGKREKEQVLLYKIASAIANVKDRNSLMKLILEEIKSIFNFYDVGLAVLDADAATCTDWSTLNPEINPSDTNYALHNLGLTKMPFKNSLFEKSIAEVEMAGHPLIYKINQQLVHDNPDLKELFEVEISYGYKEFLFTYLKSGNKIIGSFNINSLIDDYFKPTQFYLFQAVADLIAVAVANILANEEILKREYEKTHLLKISEAIASIQDYKELLKVIYEVIQPVFPFDNTGLFIADDKAGHIFEITNTDILKSTTLDKFTNTKIFGPFAIKDFEQQSWYHSTTPVITTPENEIRYIKAPACARQFDISIQSGMKEMICGPLISGGKKIGSIYLSTKQEGLYATKNINLFKSITDFIAIAVANILANKEIVEREMEKSLLLSLSRDMATIRHRDDLYRVLKEKIHPIIKHTNTYLSYLNSEGGIAAFSYTNHEHDIKIREHYKKHFPKWHPVINSPFEMLLQNEWATLYTKEDFLKKYPGCYEMKVWEENSVQVSIETPLIWQGKAIGLFSILSKDRDAFANTDLNLIKSIADQLAISVANILANEEILERESEKTLLLAIGNSISTKINKVDLLESIDTLLHPIFLHDHAVFCIVDKNRKTYTDYYNMYSNDIPFTPKAKERNEAGNKKKYKSDQFIDLFSGSLIEYFLSKTTSVGTMEDITGLNLHAPFIQSEIKQGLKYFLCSPLIVSGNSFGLFGLLFKKGNQPTEKFPSLFTQITEKLALAFSNILATEEIETLNKQLQAQNNYLIEELHEEYDFDEMIGQNQKFKDACKNIGLVAKTDSSVLILGETGTGKELVARAIHNYSPRKNKPLIKLNCAALPANLIESELFGHERGAFTGAIERRIGKFELANGSTLFLDEIGELPLELQSKLLRALQEKEVERLGSNKVIPVDVRIIAATNRDLMKEVQAGKFRLDLYYRLHIFPITLPPLRDRKEDIPLLASHFIKKYAKKVGKNIQGLNHEAMQEMISYNWPGNIRELEHVIERTTILAKTKLIQELDLPIASKNKITASAEEFVVKPWLQNERDYILAVLKVTNGNVKGKGGAAELLELPPTTLQSKMNKLGIKRKHYIEQSN